MPKAMIDGTQMPMKIPSCFSPWKYKISEKISDMRAAANRSLSVRVNFFNIKIILGNIKPNCLKQGNS
jgi:hypothetical protein